MSNSQVLPGLLRVSTFRITTPLTPVLSLIAKLPQVLVLPQLVVWVTRVFWIVTLSALTEICPVTSMPSITRPGDETVMLPLGVRVVPGGTPVLVRSG
jgi:hypothetical protein